VLHTYDFGHVNYAIGEIPGIMDVGNSEHCTKREWRVKIALLEDNPSILDYLSRALEMMGHTVHKYPDSTSLLDTLFNGERARTPLPYDLLLVDLLLPGNISGLEAIHTIRRAIPQELLPIVIISACSQKELEEVHRQLPSVPIVRKPFRIQELLQTIDEVMVY